MEFPLKGGFYRITIYDIVEKRTPTIKFIHQLTGYSLREAEQMVDECIAGGNTCLTLHKKLTSEEIAKGILSSTINNLLFTLTLIK